MPRLREAALVYFVECWIHSEHSDTRGVVSTTLSRSVERGGGAELVLQDPEHDADVGEGA